MPTSIEVLEGLARISRELSWLAAIWHGLIGAFLLALAAGWRPPGRSAAAGLSIPLASVGVIAWVFRNPFNGSVFLLAAGAPPLARRLAKNRVSVAPGIRRGLAAAALAFGWFYPHFVPDGLLLGRLWAAPVGVIPCPTLSLGIGVALLLDGACSRAHAVLLAGLGILYGLLGWLWLGVLIDAILILMSVFLLAAIRTRPAGLPG